VRVQGGSGLLPLLVTALQRERPASEDRIHGHGSGFQLLYFDCGNLLHGEKLLQVLRVF
jgi:hypothetical protein